MKALNQLSPQTLQPERKKRKMLTQNKLALPNQPKNQKTPHLLKRVEIFKVKKEIKKKVKKVQNWCTNLKMKVGHQMMRAQRVMMNNHQRKVQ